VIEGDLGGAGGEFLAVNDACAEGGFDVFVGGSKVGAVNVVERFEF